MSNLWRKTVWFGFLAWLIPFMVSLFFYTAEGKLAIDKFLFKSIMIVVGGMVGAFLLTRLFQRVRGDYLRTAVIVGFAWFGLNILLDAVVLIGFLGTGVQEYIYEIGIRYLFMPTMSIGIGVALMQAQSQSAIRTEA